MFTIKMELKQEFFHKMNEFTDCKYILVSRIGPGAENMAQQLGITAVELPGDLEEGLEKLRTYEQIQKLFE